ncbi:hypothetical protein OJAV_G00034920 [Oryzias javanicus]|uniref:Uncharacterized protein n=1 Tax=Oryzias javanicus TaxID=123683 RepID=A0A3S2ULS7_ORYJA|nr:hypothetical protein OJAV_G00034920 [Oryzias javanicus]
MLPTSSLSDNGRVFMKSLDRIIEKYTKLQHHDGGPELDMRRSSLRMIYYYMSKGTQEMTRLEAESLADQSRESFSSSNTTRDSLQSTCKNETLGSTCWLAVENNDVSGSSLESGWSCLSQPEDEDETLQMSLSSRGCSLGEVYPSMVRRIERAWHTQNLSQAADSVLRKYRRWRQQPPRSPLDQTFDVTVRSGAPSNPHDRSDLVPAQALCRLQEGPAHLRSPLTREKPPILVMDFSEPSKPAEAVLNETFIMLSPEKPAPVSTYSFSLSPKSPLKKPSFSQSAALLTFPVESRVKERPEIYSSPVRPSPLKDRKTSLFSFSRKLEENASTEVRPASLSSPLRSFYPERLQPPLPDSPRSSGRRRFRRHLSFDSSQPQSPASFSPQKIDEDFLKLYHKFVCQNKMASSNAPPCRLCVRSSAASRCHSSSALAALALSPHRPIFRKRRWELRWDASPQFKRLREEGSSLSPGSKHHRGEALRRWPLPSSQSPSKRGSSQDARPFSASNPCSPLKLFY